MAIRQPRGDSHYDFLSKDAMIKFAVRLAVVVALAVTFTGVNALQSSTRWAAHGVEESNKPDGQPTCRDVQHAWDQCDFVKQFCQSDDDGLISYFGLYYCSLPNYRVVSWFIITIWSAFLFLTIGICAGDFFTVNLSCISRALNLSDTLAGVTFLAVGNGGADIFSTWAAMTSGSPEMAIGELVGSASFITTVAAGSIAFTAPFTVHKVSLVRDAVFLLVAASFALVVMFNQELHLWHGVLMIVLYVVYVTGVIGYHWWTSRNPDVSDTGRSENNRPDEERQTHNEAVGEHQPLIHGLSGQSDDEYGSVSNSSAPLKPPARNPYKEIARWKHRHHNSIIIECDYIMQPSLVGSLEYSRHRRLAARSQRHEETSLPEDYYGRLQSLESPGPTRATLEGECDGPEVQHTTLAAEVASTLFPSLQELCTRKPWHAVFNLISAIPFFLLRITVPLVDDAHGGHSDECRHGWDRWLLLLQTFVAPQLVWAICWLDGDEAVRNHHWGVYALYMLAGSVVLCIAILTSSNSRSLPKWYKVISVAGFAMSTFWLSRIADEVVSIMKAAGVFVGISEAILGFTVFALGNSVDDFVANFSVAQRGHPIMALSACFGGPLFSILLGLGPSIIFVTSRDAKRTGTLRPIPVRVDKTLIISSAVLAATMLFLTCALRVNQWRMTKTIGSMLVATWIVLTTVNFIVELI